MALIVDHDMLWLQIAVDYQVVMEVLEGAQHLSRVELHIVLDSDLVGPDSIKQVTSAHEVHQDVNVLSVLVSGVRLDDEMIPVLRVTQVHEYFFLSDDMLSMLSRGNLGLIDHLERVLFVRLFVHCAHYDTKRARADLLSDLVVAQRKL